jgi:outer membrane receptor for ferrienterochelin and colicin
VTQTNPVANVAETLTGRIAGVQVTSTEGSPDADIKIRVRGGGSLTQDSAPLLIVDGFPVNTINDISPSDIAARTRCVMG